MSIKSSLSKFVPNYLKQKIAIKNQQNIFFAGFDEFNKTGVTSNNSHLALINLYCASNGKFNEKINDTIKITNPPKLDNSSMSGVVGKFSPNDFEKINITLNANGYVNFEKKLTKEVCQRLTDFALNTTTKIPPLYNEKIIYDSTKPMAEIYRFDLNDLVNNLDIQELMMDPALINIARNYLGCEPIFDFPAMWWSTAFQKKASSEAAQLYHFDMDRIKWLKIFIYLTDVKLENGPHSYINGSHKQGSKPKKLLNRGYVRISDEELHTHYKLDDVQIICADQGTIFAGDTKCWHKGLPLINGHRLVLELEYTSSLFGANIPKFNITNYSEEFKKFCTNNKVFAKNLLLN